MNFFSTGYIFPALIAALVPLRTYVLSYFFDPDDLAYLDPMDEAFAPPSSTTNTANHKKDDDDEWDGNDAAQGVANS
jgi:hypothetical protein